VQPSGLRFVLLHYHILKNAGTTVEYILDRSFGHRYCAIDEAERDAHFPNASLLSLVSRNPDLKAISSHQIRYPVPTVTGLIFFDLCFLRDPIDRIRSMYDYFREKPAVGDPVSEYANGLRLGEFVARLIGEMPWYVNDVQVNLLSNGIVNDCPRKEDLDRASARMMRMSFPGVVDCFTESLVAGQYFLQPVFPELDCAESAVNVTAGFGGALTERVSRVAEACGKQVFDELLSLNALDFELLDRARFEIGRRYSLVPEREARALKESLRSAESRAKAASRTMLG
jgi:Sulfotransferase family